MPSRPPPWWRRMLPGRERSADPKHRTGRLGERAAAKHLKRLGYTILERNTAIAGGELDLIAIAPDRRTMVVVEVKARLLQGTSREEADDLSRRPERHINHAKRSQLRRLTVSLQRQRSWTDRPIRIDVVAVDLRGKQAVAVRHYPGSV